MKTATKVLILALLAGAIAGTLMLKGRQAESSAEAETDQTSPDVDARAEAASNDAATAEPAATAKIPRLIDLGADQCIPCKMMAPILEELKTEYAGTFEVHFIDVWKNPEAGDGYGVQIIPTQIFFDAAGEELFRHTGFFAKEDILAKWQELGVELGPLPEAKPAFSRWEPAQPDTRPKGSVCYLCDGDIAPQTRTVMGTPAGDVSFCSPHCYLITYASMTDENKTHDSASVTDWSTGQLVLVTAATYLYGMDEAGRPTIKAFADGAAAKEEQQRSGGNVLAWKPFEAKETATRCGFCNRPVYPDDASVVRAGGMQTWGCCVMCALGVAARTGEDIEVDAKDALTGDPVRVKTYDGHVAELDPETSVAWAGAKKDAEGTMASTGCFKQAFFTNEANLMQWVEAHPTATGHQVTIEQALAAKMKLTPEQISKACKIGECVPK